MYSYTKHLLKISGKELSNERGNKVSKILFINVLRHLKELSDQLDEIRGDWAKECANNLLRK